jgi:sterol 24-C-methyltransferase
MQHQNNLHQLVNLISSSIEVKSLVKNRVSNKQIQEYYLTNHLAYLFFHNRHGFMHMGISKNGVYRVEDLIRPLKIIDRYLKKADAEKILELGPGNGSNSAYLAKKNKKSQFFGIDLSKKPLSKHKLLTNYKQIKGDFHNLSKFNDQSFDLVFAIETLCHSSSKNIVLKQVHRKLRQNGVLIILDGYLYKDKLNATERLAKRLVEKSMAVDNFEHVNKIRRVIKQTGFQILKEDNLTKKVLPTMYRFEKIARYFYKFPLVTKVLVKIIPSKITYNAVAGLLMPTLLNQKVACYFIHVLKKT